MPRSAIMMTKSLKLNLKLVYQLTHRMMICPSKCRPLNNASTGTNRCILSSSPDRALFAPEPIFGRYAVRRRNSCPRERDAVHIRVGVGAEEQARPSEGTHGRERN